MSSTYTALYYHIVFSTKHRIPQIHSSWITRLHAYMSGTVTKLDGVAYEIGGVDDHVHLLVRLNQHHTIKNFVRDLKRSSSKWVHNEINIPAFAWQEGYAAFTVSPFEQTGIKSYIRNQAEHHKTMTFIEELKWMLERAGVEYDPKYLD